MELVEQFDVARRAGKHGGIRFVGQDAAGGAYRGGRRIIFHAVLKHARYDAHAGIAQHRTGVTPARVGKERVEGELDAADADFGQAGGEGLRVGGFDAPRANSELVLGQAAHALQNTARVRCVPVRNSGSTR